MTKKTSPELLLQSSSFIKNLKLLFEEKPLFPSAKKLREGLESLKNSLDFSVKDFKKFLQDKDVLEYSRSAPRGYSMNEKNLKKVVEETSKQTQFSLLYYPDFVDQIVMFFEEHEIITSLDELIEHLTTLELPPQWTAEDIKKKLSDEDILNYSRSKPRGYSLDFEVLDEKFNKIPKEHLLSLNNELYSHQGLEEETEEINKKKKTKLEKAKIKPKKQKLKKKKKEKKKRSVKEKTKATPKKKKNSIQSSSQIQKKKSLKDIIDTIPKFPTYLLERMNSKAREAMNMGLLEINKLEIKDLKKYTEALATSRMFYNGKYENESRIIEYIDKKVRYMSNRLEELHDQEAEKYINKYVTQKIRNGKYDKIISKLDEGKNVDDVAWEITDNVGWWGRRKIPLNDYALSKRIAEILRELFPNKVSKSEVEE